MFSLFFYAEFLIRLPFRYFGYIARVCVRSHPPRRRITKYKNIKKKNRECRPRILSIAAATWNQFGPTVRQPQCGRLNLVVLCNHHLPTNDEEELRRKLAFGIARKKGRTWSIRRAPPVDCGPFWRSFRYIAP